MPAVTVTATDSSGTVSAPATATWTVDAASPMLMGCSDSPNDHGGTEAWDGWRVYTRSAMLARANATGSLRPKFLAYSVDGTPLGSSGNVGCSTMTYTAIFNYVRSELDNFYYGGTGQTHSARWGIKLYWSNGNENSDKGMLANPTQANINLFVTSQQALYDAVHYIDPVTSQRRYPDAYAGSDPTQNHEQSDIVQAWLHPSARYHDFVMWSMYPPGRQSTAADPTFTKPYLTESSRTDLQDGFLIRCFYRTYQAQLAARAATGNPNFAIAIGCGEVGIGDDPNDQDHRPYYAAFSLAKTMQTLADQYGLAMPIALWWDNQSGTGAPQNILTDEPTGTNPSTATAWRNWQTLTAPATRPANWPAAPKGSWPTGA